MREIIILDQVTSTNDYLKQYYKKLSNETIIVAKKQLNGKGRQGHTWLSQEGNLYMSILLKNVNRKDVFKNLMNVSISIVKLLKSYGISSFIKYPNDIIVNRKKISGILMETKGIEELDFLVIGIGLNVNQVDYKELNHKATSIKKETGDDFEINDVLNKLIQLLDEDKDLYKEYLMHSFVIGKQIHYKGEPYFVAGINEDGKLRLQGSNELDVHMNEISLEELYE